MGQVTITLNGRSYRLRCGDGEEARLIALAEHVDDKLAGLVVEFGQVGDERLLVMACIMVTDELFDARAALVSATATHDPSLFVADDPSLEAASAEIAIGTEPAVASAQAVPPPELPAPAEKPDEPPIKRAMRRNEAVRRAQ